MKTTALDTFREMGLYTSESYWPVSKKWTVEIWDIGRGPRVEAHGATREDAINMAEVSWLAMELEAVGA